MARRTAALALAVLAAAACSKREREDRRRPAPSAARSAAPPAADAAAPTPIDAAAPPPTLESARALARRVVVVDGHIDLPWRLWKHRAASGEPSEDPAAGCGGDFDYPRAVAGGLDAPFMSIYVPASYQRRGGAKELADHLIDMVEGLVAAHPDRMALAISPDQVLSNKEAGLLSLPLGIENGAALEGDLANVEHFYDRGVRYITLTHSRDNRIGDSSYDRRHTSGGLTGFGEEVVAEMNRLGMMIDVSHASDATFDDVLAASRAPVIASHSAARHFVPGFERDMSDEMIRALARKGGLIMISFGSAFLTVEANRHEAAARAAARRFAATHHLARTARRVAAFRARWEREHPYPHASVSDVADHIDHVRRLVGVDHIGLGSDFDGARDTLPDGLRDASGYPALFRLLLERGYSAADIEKIAGANLLRVWRRIDSLAKR